MRRKAVSTAINPIVVILLLLVALSGLLIVGRAETGILNKGVDSGVNGVQDLFSIASRCENLGTVDFDAFSESVERVYSKCKADKNDCEYASCEKMTLSTEGACYKIDKTVLTDNGLGHFVQTPPPPVPVSLAVPNIECCFSHTFPFSLAPGTRSEELDVYNPKNCDASSRDLQRCTPSDFFSITDGSKITITAEQDPAIISVGNPGVIIKISGGETDYSTCVAPP